MTITIYIDYIRHAFPCANSIYSKKQSVINFCPTNYKLHEQFDKDRSEICPDTIITDLGIKQAENLGQKYKKRFEQADLIFCSELIRCMETASIVCKNRNKI